MRTGLAGWVGPGEEFHGPMWFGRCGWVRLSIVWSDNDWQAWQITVGAAAPGKSLWGLAGVAPLRRVQ